MHSSSHISFFYLALCIPVLVAASEKRRRWSALWLRDDSSSRNVPEAGYYNPEDNGGSMLTTVPDTYPAGLGEPLNVIISGKSDSRVLVDSSDDGGLQNYYISLGFAGECLGQHSGSDQGANLGDGNGLLNETAVMRWAYGDPVLGTCTETIEGGNHFRYWIQDGSEANSGAIFMALSYEKPIKEGHDIIDNGYNLGRDWLVGNATSSTEIPTQNLTNSSSYSGSTSYKGYTYQTDVQYVSGLLSNTSDGINHYQGFSENAVDGLVAVMTVSITEAPEEDSSSSLHTYSSPPSLISILLPFSLLLLLFNRL